MLPRPTEAPAADSTNPILPENALRLCCCSILLFLFSYPLYIEYAEQVYHNYEQLASNNTPVSA